MRVTVECSSHELGGGFAVSRTSTGEYRYVVSVIAGPLIVAMAFGRRRWPMANVRRARRSA